METRILQRLIDRNANEITFLENAIKSWTTVAMHAKKNGCDEDALEYFKYADKDRKRLKALVETQYALKAELKSIVQQGRNLRAYTRLVNALNFVEGTL